MASCTRTARIHYEVDGDGPPVVLILTNYQAEKVEGTPQPLDPPAVGRLSELHMPLLVMIGTLDEPGTQESMRHLAGTVPGARLEVFEGAAHMMNLEQPERFNRALAAFLDEVR